MFVKLAILAFSMAAAQAVWNGPLAGGVPASQFPAGVSPQSCPNYPNCANPAVAVQAAPAHQGAWNQPQPAWNQPQPAWNQHQAQQSWNPAPVPQWNGNQQSPLDRGEYVGDGDYHGEGLAESGAYGNAGGDGGYNGGAYNGGAYNGGGYNGGYAGAPAGGQYGPHGAGQVPAGVDPGSCPNYPFCH